MHYADISTPLCISVQNKHAARNSCTTVSILAARQSASQYRTRCYLQFSNTHYTYRSISICISVQNKHAALNAVTCTTSIAALQSVSQYRTNMLHLMQSHALRPYITALQSVSQYRKDAELSTEAYTRPYQHSDGLQPIALCVLVRYV